MAISVVSTPALLHFERFIVFVLLGHCVLFIFGNPRPAFIAGGAFTLDKPDPAGVR
jgi:hypothetical protein